MARIVREPRKRSNGPMSKPAHPPFDTAETALSVGLRVHTTLNHALINAMDG
jgi:hypothetical protein